jgi:hypothetical protein
MKLLSPLVRRGKSFPVCASPSFISAAHNKVERLIERLHMNGLFSIKYHTIDSYRLQLDEFAKV